MQCRHVEVKSELHEQHNSSTKFSTNFGLVGKYNFVLCLEKGIDNYIENLKWLGLQPVILITINLYAM